MNTDVNIYNIIWADDECFTLKEDENIRQLFDDKGIEVLDYVPTSEKLRIALDAYKDKVDAVVIDGNFSRDEVPFVEANDISGLVHSLSLIEIFNIRRDIPFFLYTGKKQMLQELCTNGELRYFNNNKRIFQKGQVRELTTAIIAAVEHIQSVEFRVRKRYSKILDFAKLIDDNCYDELYEYLLNDARDIEFDRTEAMFNNLRNILERIVDFCKMSDITPQDVQTLNQFKYYWGRRGLNGCPYIPKTNDLMSPTMVKSLESLIDIVQDGSHHKDNLNLFVREYVTETQTPFLFRTCLYLTLDVIRWYNEIAHNLKNGSLRLPLYVQKISIPKKMG